MDGLSAFITAITGGLADFTAANLGSILVAVLGITSGLAIAWTAYRLIVRKVNSAMRRGRLG